MFEGDLFKLKQKYINQDMTDELWRKLMIEGEELLKKYDLGNEMLDYYCFQSFATFVDFLDHKKGNKYEFKVRQGLLEM